MARAEADRAAEDTAAEAVEARVEAVEARAAVVRAARAGAGRNLPDDVLGIIESYNPVGIPIIVRTTETSFKNLIEIGKGVFKRASFIHAKNGHRLLFNVKSSFFDELSFPRLQRIGDEGFAESKIIENAFKYNAFKTQNMESNSENERFDITLNCPSLTYVGESAFESCEWVRELIAPRLEHVGRRAFKGTNLRVFNFHLTKLTFPIGYEDRRNINIYIGEDAVPDTTDVILKDAYDINGVFVLNEASLIKSNKPIIRDKNVRKKIMNMEGVSKSHTLSSRSDAL